MCDVYVWRYHVFGCPFDDVHAHIVCIIFIYLIAEQITIRAYVLAFQAICARNKAVARENTISGNASAPDGDYNL